MNIFDYLYPTFKFPKNHKIKLFESFSGIGCQKMALERLTDNYEVVGISEIDKYALASYKAMHGKTKNYGDISKLSGGGMPSIDIFTYSFPCQDLSIAGQQKGMNKNTRSGLVYQVLRILNEMKQHNNLPKVLLMENVTGLISQKFIKQFNEIQLELEQLGYKNYTQVLIATDYGIPQTRERVFMVSVLGDYNYTFPKPIPLKTRLKDYLETQVDEKYYLTKKLYKYLTDMTDRNGFVRGERFSVKTKNDIANTILTSPGNRATDNFILNDKETYCQRLIDENLVNEYDVISHSYTNNRMTENVGRVECENGLAPTITTKPDTLGVVVKDEYIKIPSANLQGYELAKSGDGIYLDRPHQKRGTVQENKIQTLKTSGNDVGVVLKENGRMNIRKLTPLECWRLMGIEDHYFHKAKGVNSNAQLYKQAGNGIVVDVLEHIFREMVE